MSHSNMREIVELAQTIDDESVMNAFVFQVARTVDSITEKAEETDKELSSAERRYSENVDAYNDKNAAEEV